MWGFWLREMLVFFSSLSSDKKIISFRNKAHK